MTFYRIYKNTLAAALIFMGAVTLSNVSVAQDAATDIGAELDLLPVTAVDEETAVYDSASHTHPPLKLTPDKSELIRLEKSAGSIIIGNPNHLSILADTSKTLVAIPKAPGATHFTILDKSGNLLMQRHVIVASPKKKYMRVRRSCAGSDNDECQQTSVFYCPDMCHEIMIGSAESTDSSSGDDDDPNAPQSSENEVTSPPADTDTE